MTNFCAQSNSRGDAAGNDRELIDALEIFEVALPTIPNKWILGLAGLVNMSSRISTEHGV